MKWAVDRNISGQWKEELSVETEDGRRERLVFWQNEERLTETAVSETYGD